jgi:carbonic anhydrase/acetyltransferase-like protein (isoleucine patch superfamily)
MTEPIFLSYAGESPTVDPSAWVAPGAVISGDTHVGADSSVWFGAVLRGDINCIRIGCRTNLQDGVVCHVNFGDAALEIGDDVSVGHGAVLHGCVLESGCLVGIGARVLDRAVVGRQSLVAAGSVVREGTKIPSGELWAGAPAVKKRDLSPEEKQGLLENAAEYVELSRNYAGRGSAGSG